MLIATAGHIDHGKTSLVRALTGVETDRLPEEKARGISIDLGFAHWSPEPGLTIGFVDVPGHERFVRNMLAGVAAVDFALVAIAADDGVMPQTIEHVQILDLLGIARGFVVITKCDRALGERIAQVREQARLLLARTRLAGASMFEVSSITGAGIPELKVALLAAVRAETEQPRGGRFFRLAIDRAFSVTGVGVVVTGTSLDGDIETNARLMLAPQGLEVRVRGLQTGGKTTTRVTPGHRCALNLTGVDLSQVRRGDWLEAPEVFAPTSRIAVELRILPEHPARLKHNTPAHLHIGTSDIGVRVLMAGQKSVAPGEAAVAHLVLEHETCAMVGDRFVLRDPAARHTIGGGRVIDPFGRVDRRRNEVKAAIVHAQLAGSAPASLAGLLAIDGCELDARSFAKAHNLPFHILASMLQDADAVLCGADRSKAVPRARITAIEQAVTPVLQVFHRTNPTLQGMPVGDVEKKIAAGVSPDVFHSVLRDMAEQKVIVSSGAAVWLPTHRAVVANADVRDWQALIDDATARDGQVFTLREMAAALGKSENDLRGLILRMRGKGDLWRIADDKFMLQQKIAEFARIAAALDSEVGGNGFSAAQYRDATGVGRGLAIQVLEFFDRMGVSRRSGDLRRIKPDHEQILKRALQLERGKPAVTYMQKLKK